MSISRDVELTATMNRTCRWAAAHNRKTPAYDVVERSGPHHAPRFRVKATLGTFAEAEAEGSSKQEAETAAAAALLAKLR